MHICIHRASVCTYTLLRLVRKAAYISSQKPEKGPSDSAFPRLHTYKVFLLRWFTIPYSQASKQLPMCPLFLSYLLIFSYSLCALASASLQGSSFSLKQLVRQWKKRPSALLVEHKLFQPIWKQV